MTGPRHVIVMGDQVSAMRQVSRLQRGIAGEVRAYMARARVTETELGEALGHNQQWVNRRTSGAVAFSGPELQLIADYLGVKVHHFFDIPPDDFYEGTGDDELPLNPSEQSTDGLDVQVRPLLVAA